MGQNVHAEHGHSVHEWHVVVGVEDDDAVVVAVFVVVAVVMLRQTGLVSVVQTHLVRERQQLLLQLLPPQIIAQGA